MSKINILDDLQNQPNDKIEAIKKILPDCFDKDGNLIAGKLKEVLSQEFEKPDIERFTFNWAGKQKAREIAYKTYTEGTLKFDKDKSKNFETTKNLIIEGDNLQVLKLLKNSYKGKVKCIYIDPPYNTGSDFVYNDKFELDIKKYLIETGEIDEETGEQMADYIQKDDGKKHSKWLSFMYPRLMVAREMLREDGVIFISIDDNEVHHLRLLMNEVFGEENGLIPIIWKKGNAQNDAIGIQKNHEYILGYFRDEIDLKYSDKTEKKLMKDENGWFYLGSGLVTGGAGGTLINRLNLGYSIYFNEKTKDFIAIDDYNKELAKTSNDEKIVYQNNLDLIAKGYTKIIRPPKKHKILGRWTWSMEKINNSKNLIHITENYSIVQKIYVENPLNKDNIEIESELPPKSIIEESSASGSKILNNIFEGKIFDNPKPVSLVKHLLQISTSPSDLILDFFAGSGTTGQAVMELNQEELDKQAKDGLFGTPHPTSPSGGEEQICGGRRFILVQLPEKIDAKKEAFKAGYKHISDITIERVKRAGEKYKSVDNGFKVLQLADNPDRTNLFSLGSLDNNEFILTHLALLYGYGLNYKLIKIAEKEIYMMKSEIEKTKDAIIILEQKPLIMEDISLLIKKYGKGKYKFFSRDSALNIELTYNLLQHFNEDNVVVF